MNSGLWALILGGGGLGLLSFIYTLYKDIRDRRHREETQEGEVKLSQKTMDKVAAEAASLNTADIIKIGQLWQEQFNAVREELAIEQRWRKRVTKYIRRHQPWDIKMEQIAKEHNWPIDPAPRIDLTGEDDDDEEPLDRQPWHQ